MHPELDVEKIKKLQQSKEESKSSLSKFWSVVKSGFKHVKNYVFGESNKQEVSLSVYLDFSFKLLTGIISLNDTHPIEVVDDIVYIFQSLHKYCFHSDGYPHPVPADNIKRVCSIVINASCAQICFV